MNDNHITVGGLEIPVTYELRDIFKLHFYKENPRIASIIVKHDAPLDDDFIEKQLWERNETHALKRRIEKHNGLIHPVIIYKDYVIEGNTRLCAYRRLYKQAVDESRDPSHWSKISCQVLQRELDKKRIYELLGDEHILGKIDWNTYEKGCWMTRMMEVDDLDSDEIANIIGLSVSTVRNHITAYMLMVEKEVEEPKKFSHFLQLVGNAEIKKIEKHHDDSIIDKCVDAIKEGQFRDAKDLRKIPKIYKDRTARKRFFEYGEDCDDVYTQLKADHPSVGSTFINTANDVCERMRKLKRKEREDLSSDAKARYRIEKLAKDSNKLNDEIKKIYEESQH